MMLCLAFVQIHQADSSDSWLKIFNHQQPWININDIRSTMDALHKTFQDISSHSLMFRTLVVTEWKINP
jgi:hypothetical protein